jgi:hypothetical protein
MPFRTADMHALHRLMYFSHANVGSADEFPGVMQAILDVAVPANMKRGISGALLACDGWFIQALEGNRLTIGETYQRICKDRRHKDPTVIKSGPIEQRNFADWSMCGQTLSATDDAIIHILETKKSFNPAALTWRSALNLLEIVRDLQSKVRH